MTETTDRLVPNYWTEEEGAYEYVGDIQWGESSYDFDLTAIFRNKETGDLLMDHDSGCSCPTPFEEATAAEATPIKSLVDFDEAIKARDPYYIDYPASVDQMVALREKVGALL